MRTNFLSWSRAVLLLAAVGAIGSFAGCSGNVSTSGSGTGTGNGTGTGASTSTSGSSNTSTGGGDCTSNGPCKTNADCGADQMCVYSIADGCAAQGQCLSTLPPPGTAECFALEEMCGCDGSMVTNAACGWCLGAYATGPTTGKSWPCADGG
jgi:hypothetical protein